MKTSFTALALLLAAPAATQVLTFPQIIDTHRPFRWHDVHFVATAIAPIAVGSELGLAVFNNETITFRFLNWTQRELRVHAVGWQGTGAARLEGQQVCSFTSRTAYPFAIGEMGGFGWTSTSFVIGQVDPLFICTPETRWHFMAWDGLVFRNPVPHAFVVTAVGGW